MASAAQQNQSEKEKVAKGILLILLFSFSCAAIIFSLYVLFSDLSNTKQVSPAQARGMFTVFANTYINEIHPIKLPAGKSWSVETIEFKNDHIAEVLTTTGENIAKLEFIFNIEPPNVRVMKINDISTRDLQDAHLALIRYLDDVRQKNYIEAAKLYGGPLSRLLPYGDGVTDVAQLLERYCKTVSTTGECMVFTVLDRRRDEPTDSYRFTVQYLLPDGSAYATKDGKNKFSGIVEFRDTQFYVLSLPFD